MTPKKIDFASLITGGVTALTAGGLQNFAWDRTNGPAISTGFVAAGAVMQHMGGLPTNGAALYHSGLAVLAYNLPFLEGVGV